MQIIDNAVSAFLYEPKSAKKFLTPRLRYLIWNELLSVVHLGRYASDYMARQVARRKDFLLVLSTTLTCFSSGSNRSQGGDTRWQSSIDDSIESSHSAGAAQRDVDTSAPLRLGLSLPPPLLSSLLLPRTHSDITSHFHLHPNFKRRVCL